MTPWICTTEIAAFLREQIARYEEGKGAGEVHAGFLPITNVRQLKKEQCPHVVLRPQKIEDGEKMSVAKMAVYIVTYDEDEETLYHVLEFIRFALLTHTPILNRWRIVPGTLETSIPDEQPYPKLWGRMDFDVILPQAEHKRLDILGKA